MTFVELRTYKSVQNCKGFILFLFIELQFYVSTEYLAFLLMPYWYWKMDRYITYPCIVPLLYHLGEHRLIGNISGDMCIHIVGNFKFHCCHI